MNIDKYISSFLFGIITSYYIYTQNNTSDSWPLIFFSVIISNIFIQNILKSNIKNYNINKNVSIISLILFLIHPIINMLGSYTKLSNGLSYEPFVLYGIFILYKFFGNPIKFDKIKTDIKNELNYDWLNYFTPIELIIYLIFLILPMILYNDPNNIIMVVITLLTGYYSLLSNNFIIGKAYNSWNRYMLIYLFTRIIKDFP
jgi:hypothetical protein